MDRTLTLYFKYKDLSGKIGEYEVFATAVVNANDNTEFILSSDASNTYTAGNGLSESGNEFSINTSITADLSTAQTLDSKTLTGVVSAEYDSGNSVGVSNQIANYLATTDNTSTSIHTNTMGGTTNTDGAIIVRAQVV